MKRSNEYTGEDCGNYRLNKTNNKDIIRKFTEAGKIKKMPV